MIYIKSIIKLELVARSPSRNKKVTEKSSQTAECCKVLLLQIRRRMEKGESGTCTDAHSLVVFFLHLHSVGTVDGLWLKKESDLGIGRDAGYLENWKGGRLNFMTFTYICMLWNHMTSFHPSADFLSATLSPEGGATSSTRTTGFDAVKETPGQRFPEEIFFVYSTLNSPHSIFKSLF